MSDPLKTLLGLPELKAVAFSPTSRYHGVDTASRTLADGTVQIYLKRRFVPDPDALAPLREHSVVLGDRLDKLAALYLGDPELFWRICDANGAIRPDELIEEVGRRLRIALPQGMPGGADV